jgi:hypothetical protein
MLDGHIDGFAAGLRLHGDPVNHVTYCDNNTTGVFVLNFAHICREIDQFFVTGQTPVSVERCLLTTLTIAAAMRQLALHPGVRVATPELGVGY